MSQTTSSSSNLLTCVLCQTDLEECKFIEMENGNLCLSCFEMEYSNRCAICRKLIRLDQQEINIDGMHWHDSCFNCSLCNLNLVKKYFGFTNSQLICTECYSKESSLECSKCTEKFRNGQPVYEFEGTFWHDECFRCSNCDFPIGARPFIPTGSKPVCIDCFEQKYIRNCHKCGKALKADGLESGDKFWHEECFCCLFCGKGLSTSGDFVSRENEIICTECYSKRFLKKCLKCGADIEGLKGLKFVNFENYNWHTRCFSCSRCNCGLIDKGFVMFGSDILCPNCAKNKL